MISLDDDGIVNVEYGHGSVMGAIGIQEDGTKCYSMTSIDPLPIGTECNIGGKVTDVDFGASVRLIFRNKISLKQVIEDLTSIYDNFEKDYV